MSQQSQVEYFVPTHLQQREPFAFGRDVVEIAKLVVVGLVAARLVGSEDVPAVLRVPASVLVLLVGAMWALVRIQGRPLDDWIGLAFRYGATPRRRVWRSDSWRVTADGARTEVDRDRGWYQLEQVRVRWRRPDRGPESDAEPAAAGFGGRA